MKKSYQFSDVLEAAESLPLDAQTQLVEILRKRTIEQRRLVLAKEIRNARSEHRRGRSKPTSPDAIMQEILS